MSKTTIFIIVITVFLSLVYFGGGKSPSKLKNFSNEEAERFIENLKSKRLSKQKPANDAEILNNSEKNTLSKEEAKFIEKVKSNIYCGKYELPVSKAKLNVGQGYAFFLGEFVNNTHMVYEYNDYVEGLLYDTSYKTIIYFSNFKTGYVSLENLKNIDLEKMIKIIGEKIGKKGQSEFSESCVIGWVKKPVFCKENDSILFSVEIENKKACRGINFFAVKLGRYGCELIDLTKHKNLHKVMEEKLDKVIRGFEFGPGLNYSDHAQADGESGYDITNLLYLVLENKCC